MWHLINLVAVPIAFLLGLFCVLSAIVLYPGEEGKIQSKFEDFWIRVDDFQNLALTHHAAFMTQVARVETGFLNLVFGCKLFSAQAIIVSCCCSLALTSLFNIRFAPRPSDATWWQIVLVTSIVTGVACIVIRDSPRIQLGVVMLALAIIVVRTLTVPLHYQRGEKRLVFVIVLTLIGGFVCDVLFIATTRRLVRWMAEMTNSLRVIAVVAVNLLLGFGMYAPALIGLREPPSIYGGGAYAYFVYVKRAVFVAIPNVAVTNLIDILLALLFILLALILLVHRALWPLLTRTFFRIQDIGTKGRRGILGTVGFALLGWSGAKLPELVKELAKALG